MGFTHAQEVKSGRPLRGARWRGRPRASRHPMERDKLPFQIKKLCWARKKSSVCVVYEDMSCSRRNTMSTPNHYH